MCGFTGIYRFNEKRINNADIKKMNDLIKHRGPDDEGYLLIDTRNNFAVLCSGNDTNDKVKSHAANVLQNKTESNLVFGFRRLSIIDTNPTGFQPMKDNVRNIWICFNGEIYNYLELREELEGYGHRFSTNTDTEVILKSYVQWGFECQNKFNGMWSFVLYDLNEELFFCSRDRFGVKPFYYYYNPENEFIFASEIKPILSKVKGEINNYYLCNLLVKGYSDHNEESFYKGINKLKPGCFITIKKKQFTIKRYYKPETGVTDVSEDKKIVSVFRDLLYDSIKLRLRSDVPVGFALSGGIDSSSIVCAANGLCNNKIKTFSLVYTDKEIDERYFINAVTEKTGISNYQISPSTDDFESDFKEFLYYQEEPVNGLSYYGEFKLREFIKQNGITVSIDGQGADEIVSGYNKYVYPYLADVYKNDGLYALKQQIANYKKEFNIEIDIKAILKLHYKNITGLKISGTKNISKRFPYLNKDFIHEYYQKDKFKNVYSSTSYLNNDLQNDLFYTSLPFQLNKADKSAMAFSVECRFPFLDYRLVEYSFSLPDYFKINNGTSKYILREALKELLPESIYRRKDKVGFAVPQNIWFKTGLKDLMLKIFNENNITKYPFLAKTAFSEDIKSSYIDKLIPDAKLSTLFTTLMLSENLNDNIYSG